MEANLVKESEKTNLEKFYQGWHHFASMNMGLNFIVFKVTTPKQAAESIKAAEKRIAEKQLPLEVISTGERSNTFIVRGIAA